MEALKKYFPLMPEEKNVGKLILALLFYVYVPTLVGGLLVSVLGLTVILAPVGAMASFVCTVYGLVGVVKSVLAYLGKDLKSLCCKGE